MKHFLLSIVFCTLYVFTASAQWDFGVATSNWSGISSLYMNPANLADSRTKFSFEITSFNVGVVNNLGTLNFSDAINKFVNGKTADVSKVFNFSSNNQFSLIAPYADIHGPGVMFNSKHKYFFAITTRLRGINQFNNFSQSFYRLINTKTLNNNELNLVSPSFNWTAHIWTESAVSFGMVVLNKGKSKLKAGTTLKFLGGVGYITIKGNNLNISYKNGTDSFFASKTDLEYASSFMNTTDAISNGVFSNNPLGNFLSAKIGSGFGMDLGLVYEYCPDNSVHVYEMDGKTGIVDNSQNNYRLRLSASVTDMGHTTYPSNLNANLNVTGNGYLTGTQLLNNVKDFTSFKNYALTKGFTVDTSAHDTKLYLPTALMLGVDYHIYKSIYINATNVTNLANIQNYGNSYYNTFAVTPRWDTRRFTVAVPISYGSLAGDMRLGIGLRAYGFFVGSDDMLAYFSNNHYGMSLYMGGCIPLSYKIPRDRDHDHVSDRKDKCPRQPGPWELNGCPELDRDHDGIPDAEDNCPDIPGSKSANGCPDRDGDGVEDDMDRCPDQAGPASLQGCPDRDGDGVPDIDDACPDVAGEPIMHGCPDRDGDGIPDNEDACPDVAGPASAHGCPDRDGDGVPDNIDKCPDEPGPADNQGCPVKKEVPRVHEKLSETVLHPANGKVDFGAGDFKPLAQIIKLMGEHPDYNVEVEGYPDKDAQKDGEEDKNLTLAQTRADNVKNYFIAKGIDAGRIKSTGFGSILTSEAGKGGNKNRRIIVKMVN